MYSVEELDIVHNTCGCKFYQLSFDGYCLFSEFVETINRSAPQDKKKFNSIITMMDNYSPHKLLPATKFGHIKGVCRQDVYEFKKDALRVYAIIQEPDVFIILGGFKTKQPSDIKRLNQYIKSLPQDIII